MVPKEQFEQANKQILAAFRQVGQWTTKESVTPQESGITDIC
jgi:hypothetical protein